MTEQPTNGTTAPSLKQMNVRLPADLIEQVDARRALVAGGISRDKWVARALRFALAQSAAAQRTAPGRRTAPRR